MSACASCDKTKNIDLSSGREVCAYCPDLRMECEARDLLRMPLDKRRTRLDQIRYYRGDKATETLKKVMAVLWQKNRPTKKPASSHESKCNLAEKG